MHRLLFLFFSFFITLSSGSPFSRTTLAWLDETESDAIIDGVHLLSGQFCMHEVDYIVPGPTPIRLERFYNASSGSIDGFRYFDWHILSWYKTKDVEISPMGWKSEKKGVHISSYDPSGSCFTYAFVSGDASKNQANLSLDKSNNCLGLTNTGGGVISGQTSVIHRSVHKNGKAVHVRLPDGTRRLFRSWVLFKSAGLSSEERLQHPEPNLRRSDFPNDKLPKKSTNNGYEKTLWWDMRHHNAFHAPPFEKERGYCIDFVSHPNGNVTHYGYGTKMDVTKVSVHSQEKGKELSSIYLRHGYWSDKPNHLSRKKIQISTCDDKTFTYHVRSYNDHTVFDHVEGPGVIEKSLDYQRIKGKPLISKITLPEGRFKEFEFFPKQSPYAGKIKAVYVPAGKSGAKVPSLAIRYHNEHLLSAFNALKGKTNYHFNQEFRLEHIHKFLGDKVVYKQQFIWGGEANTQLICKLRRGPHDGIKYAHYYQYDGNGNVLTEDLLGYLSGKHGVPVLRLNKDRPIGGERYSVRRMYQIKNGSDLKFNLIKAEEDDFGHKTTFAYKPKTNLLTEKSTFFQDKLTRREIFTYNEDALCTEKMLDDGEAFTERHTTHISPRTEQPGLAMPETIRQTITTSSGEKLLSTKKITYGTWHKPIKEEVYDSKNNLAYTLTYSYDEMGNLASKTDALGNTTHYSYDANKNLTLERLPLKDHAKSYTYDLMNRLTQVTYSSPEETFTTSTTYDACGNKTTSTNEKGYTTHYAYDSLNRLIKKTSPPITDQEDAPFSPTETYAYNALDQLSAITHADGSQTITSYTTRGDPIHIKHPDGTEERFTYRLDGKLLTHTNRLGATSSYTYDNFDNITHTRATDPSGNLLYETSDIYDAFHHLSHTDALGNTTTYSYNTYGKLSKEETEGTNGYTTYDYDTLGRQIAIHYFTDDALQYSEYKTYDLNNQVTATWIEHPDGSTYSKTETTYDALGREISNTTYGENGSETTRTSYDILGRPTKTTDPIGAETTYTYKPLFGPKHRCFCTESTDSIGRTTKLFHDGLSNLRQTLQYDPTGALILRENQAYDAMGNLVLHTQDSLSDEPAYTVQQTYGPGNLLLSTTEAPNTSFAKTTKYLYNKRALLKTKIKPDGVQLHYTYDLLGSVSSLKTDQIAYFYAYDKAGRLISVKDGSNNLLLKRSYDPFSNLTEDSYSTTLHHTYDTCGRQLSTTLPDQSVISYRYDGPALFSSTYKGKTTSISKRDPSNRIAEITLVSGEIISKTYDPCGRLTSIEAPHFSQTNTYDTASRLTHQMTQDPLGSQEHHYTYDALDQLLSEEGSHPQTYTYDALYNRTSHNTKALSHNPLNQIKPASHLAPTYNACGHLTHKKTPTEDLSFTYDALDRLIKIESPAFTYAFTYDPLDRRITES